MDELEKRTMGKVTSRLVPFLMLCYFIAYLDRVNVGFAGASMSRDLGLSAAAFGGAAGIFFIAYFFFEVPSNLALNLEGVAGLHGWQWMFLIEAAPALLMAFAVWFYLTDRPADALWLRPEESKWLQDRLDAERRNRESLVHLSWLRALRDPRVIALGFVYMGANIPQYG